MIVETHPSMGYEKTNERGHFLASFGAVLPKRKCEFEVYRPSPAPGDKIRWARGLLLVLLHLPPLPPAR